MLAPRLSAPLVAALVGAWVLFATSGCVSFESRTREKAAVFATLDTATRARLEAGEVRIGDTPDLVYLALGQPSEKKTQLTAEGHAGTWIYTASWQEYQGTRLVGYRRDMVYNSATKSYQVVLTPDYQPVYVPRAEDRIRVTFTAGVVSSIEQAQASAKPQGGLVR